MAVSLGYVPERRRKYAFDIASSTGPGRLSVFLDERDALTFEVADAGGAVHTTSGPPDSVFHLNEFVIVSCEAGWSDREAIQQLRVNDELVYELRRRGRQPPIGPIDFKLSSATLGADVTGARNAAMDLGEILVLDRLLEFRERLQCFSYLEDKWFGREEASPP
jgi:hypothetical protein